MAKIIIYIAQSLNGKIAEENGSIDWLNQFETEDYGYNQFLSTIKVVLMGNKTYHQVLTFGNEFPYKSKEVYVFSRNKAVTKDYNVSFISENIACFVENLKKSSNSNIWLVGGAEIITILVENEMVDELRIFTMPIILRSGINLNSIDCNKKLKLIDTKTYNNGVLESNYEIIY